MSDGEQRGAPPRGRDARGNAMYEDLSSERDMREQITVALREWCRRAQQ
ncbi:hypothetical protein [Gemmatimonas sp.]